MKTFFEFFYIDSLVLVNGAYYNNLCAFTET